MDKKSRKHTQSSEEIAAIPSSRENLSRAQIIRHSLQTVTTTNESPLRQTRSHNYGNPRKQPTTILLTDRIDEEEDSTTEPEKITTRSDIRGSQTSKKSHRSRSGSATSKIRKESNTHDNRAFEGNLDSISVISGRSVGDARSNRSTRSSTRTSSVSLEVQREQYCCQSKWTPCEKRLTALVVVLVTIIILLLIAIAALATKSD